MTPPASLLSKPNGETYTQLSTGFYFLIGQGVSHYIDIAATTSTNEDVCGSPVYSITVDDLSK